MGELRVMRGRNLADGGDSKLIWDSNNEAETKAAREMYDKLKKDGFLAYAVNKKGEKAEVIRAFDPEAEKIIMTPPLVGG